MDIDLQVDLAGSPSVFRVIFKGHKCIFGDLDG